MRRDVKLYNVMFPLWMILTVTWQGLLLVIPGNFIIDSIVLLILMRVLKITPMKDFYLRHIWSIFFFGLIADAAGAGLMLALSYAGAGQFGDEWYLTVPGLLVSAGLIFALNYFVTFRKCGKRQRLIMSLTFAIATAPYTFLVPSSLMYRM